LDALQIRIDKHNHLLLRQTMNVTALEVSSGKSPLRASDRLEHWLIPNFISGHSRYVELVKQLFVPDCRWLDAGGGRRIFPDEYDGEAGLVNQADLVVTCDRDLQSIKAHASIQERVCCDLTSLPFVKESFNFITCAMVVEHLADPAKVFTQFADILDRKGRLVLFTVNVFGYATMLAMLSKVVPSHLRRFMISRITGREERDIFPTLYRCNTIKKLSEHLGAAGLTVEKIIHEDSRPLFRSFLPLCFCELLYLKLLRFPWLSGLRGNLLVVAKKP
jgi:2-polyprenyl-3-methyl-5-hydroxy-6-metoxy-1,4-benzoquinol methylase